MTRPVPPSDESGDPGAPRAAGWYERADGDVEYFWDGRRWTGQRRFGSFASTSPDARSGRASRRGGGRTDLVQPASRLDRRVAAAVAVVAVILLAWWLSTRGGSGGSDIDPADLPTGFGIVVPTLR